MEWCSWTDVLSCCTHRPTADQEYPNRVGDRHHRGGVSSQLFFVPFHMPTYLWVKSGCVYLLCVMKYTERGKKFSGERCDFACQDVCLHCLLNNPIVQEFSYHIGVCDSCSCNCSSKREVFFQDCNNLLIPFRFLGPRSYDADRHKLQ